jgi:hypothetical protein
VAAEPADRASPRFNHYDLVYDVFTLDVADVPGDGTRAISAIRSINDFRGHYDYNSGGHLDGWPTRRMASSPTTTSAPPRTAS